MTDEDINKLEEKMLKRIETMPADMLQKKIDAAMERYNAIVEKHERLIASMTFEEAQKYYSSFGLVLRKEAWEEYNEKYNKEEASMKKIKTT